MIGLRWANTQQLKKDRDAALQLVKADGLRLCFDMQERDKAKEIFLPILLYIPLPVIFSRIADFSSSLLFRKAVKSP